MTALAATVALTVLLAGGLAVGLRRDLRRAVERRRRREWLRANPQAVEFRARFAKLQREIGEALLPAMQEAVRAMARFEQAINRDREGRP